MGLSASIAELFGAGGWVMYPLSLLSIVALAMALERGVFWLGMNARVRQRRLSKVLAATRSGDITAARKTAAKLGGVYGRFMARLLDEASSGADRSRLESVALELVEGERAVIDRFSTSLSTIITAAPMLGILGTVTGIIASFQILGSGETVTDPTAVAGGIAEALLTTAFGLIVALVSLFPYAASKAQSDRCYGRLEMAGAVVALRCRPSDDATTRPGPAP